MDQGACVGCSLEDPAEFADDRLVCVIAIYEEKRSSWPAKFRPLIKRNSNSITAMEMQVG